MPSLIEEYSNDVYISFRQKDNRHDGWVTEFADHLKQELETTFKEDVNIYFDPNQKEALPENNGEVQADSLKSLIFLPVISRTYCDPGCFPWEHEFKLFVQNASNDRFGLNLRSPDGTTVTSRILPVRIYDLDRSDTDLFETVSGVRLQGIEFVYKEPGVNRPLLPGDTDMRNLNKTLYRNQINKVANEIRKIISAFGTGEKISQKPTGEAPAAKDKKEKSIAVLPFVDMSSDQDQNYFCDGMAEEIINALAHNEDLKVISRTSAFAFRDKHEDVREIGKKLGVETLLEGSVRKSGNHIRINAQLINVNDGTHLWSERFDKEAKDVFEIQDEISMAIFENLKIKLLDDKPPVIPKLHSENIEAYNLYLKGTGYWQMLTAEGYRKAAECFEKALRKDPNYALAYMGLSYVTGYSTGWGNLPPNTGFPRIRTYLDKVMELDRTLADAYAGLAGLNVYFYWNWKEAERYFKMALKINPNSSQIHLDYSNFLTFSKRHDEAIVEAKKAQELDPYSVYINTYTGFAFDYAGMFDEAIAEYQRTLGINPDYFLTHYHLGRAYSAKGMIRESIAEFEKAVDLSEGTPLPMSVLASIYYRTGNTSGGDKLLKALRARSEKEYVPATTLYLIYRTRNEEKIALSYLRQACKDHDTLLPWFRAHPALVPEGSVYMKLLDDAGFGK
jgi:TolB-like protein/Tfp pilus assembly protein PilF